MSASKLKTHQIILVSLVIASGQIGVATSQAQEDTSAEFSRARSFYEAHQFYESLILLTELERRIASDPRKTNDLLDIKAHMALAHLGLNQNDQARATFGEMCKLDSRHVLDSKGYPSQAIVLYNDVKADCASISRHTPSADGVSVTQSTFVRGKELYDKGEFTDALKYFTVVLALDYTHELAREYSKLAQQRLDILAERGYIEWRNRFEARQFDKAAAAYRRIRDDKHLSSGKMATQIASEYEKEFSDLLGSWTQACATRELTKLDSIWNDALAMASELPFGRDALAQMRSCPPTENALGAENNRVTLPGPAALSTKPAPLTDLAPSPAMQTGASCIQGDPLLAMTRAKKLVNPQIEPNLQRYMGRGILVSIRIDEQGNVTVKDVANANPRIADAIKSAVEQWTFNPTVVGNRLRCVETDLPIRVIQPSFPGPGIRNK